jgi:hypothetical protein
MKTHSLMLIILLSLSQFEDFLCIIMFITSEIALKIFSRLLWWAPFSVLEILSTTCIFSYKIAIKGLLKLTKLRPKAVFQSNMCQGVKTRPMFNLHFVLISEKIYIVCYIVNIIKIELQKKI